MPTSIAGMDFKWHFSSNEFAQIAVEAVVEAFGEAFVAPYASELQPLDSMIFNAESLLQFDLPAGMSMKPYAELAKAESIGTAINSLMQGLAPIMSAYGFLMPIIEVIIAIIEVLCALMNPFAVKRALKKLLRTYLPKLIAMFPFMAGVIIVISIIKMILAIVMFLLTVVWPMLELIKKNAEVVNDAFRNIADGNFNSDKVDAGKEKIDALIVELMNQLGVLKAFLPLLEMIMAILQLALRFPCKKDCCDQDVCPDILKNPPAGRAFLFPTTYGESEPYFAYKLNSTDTRILELIKYNQSSEQLNQQLDESVSSCCPAGTELNDCPNFTVKVTTGRGQSNELSVPIVQISPAFNNTVEVTVISAELINFIGYVNFEIVPNFDILFARQVIGIGCHPEIAAERAAAEAAFPNLERPIINFPEVSDLYDRCKGVSDGLDSGIGDLGRLTIPYDLDRIDAIQNNMVSLLNDFANDLKRRLRGLVDKTTNINKSKLEVDKSVVRANATDLAVVSVTPVDDAGSLILKNLPEDTIPSVEIYSTIGSLSNKRFDRTSGSVLMDLKSPLTGMAEITAKINSDFIADKIEGVQVIRKVNVRFVADSALPARRSMPIILDKQPKRG